MSQMNTRIGCIARRQSQLGGFALFPEHKSSNAPLDSGDDNEMTTSQWFTLCPSWQKGEVAMKVVRHSW